MWQGVEYTAAPGGMEEAIKNYCKKETGEPLLFFPGKCRLIGHFVLVFIPMKLDIVWFHRYFIFFLKR